MVEHQRSGPKPARPKVVPAVCACIGSALRRYWISHEEVVVMPSLRLEGKSAAIPFGAASDLSAARSDVMTS